MQRPLLVGEYDFTLDAKNRIAVPARLRPVFADGIVLSRWYENSIAAFPPEEFVQLLNEPEDKKDRLSSKARAQVRFVATSAFEEKLDRQGRVTIPARLLEYASITRDVTVVGVRDHIEVWDRGAWADYLKTIEEGADAIADELAAS